MADWQNQNFKKTGPATSPAQMNGKIGQTSSSSLHSKIAQPTDCGHMPAMKKFADGGAVDQEATDKMAGMEASKDDNVSFFDRLKMGNIDEKGSAAYNRFGAGRVSGDAAEMTRESRRGAPAESAAADVTAPDATVEAQPYKADESASLSRLAAARADTTSSMKEPKAASTPAPASAAKRVAASVAKAMSEGDSEKPRTASAPSKSIMNPQIGFQLVKPAPKPEPKVFASPVRTSASSGRNPGQDKPKPSDVASPTRGSSSSGRNPG